MILNGVTALQFETLPSVVESSMKFTESIKLPYISTISDWIDCALDATFPQVRLDLFVNDYFVLEIF